ncbi:DUF11 domain-containing protein [Cytophaga sp. FL35]|uniref:DUF11 domain-containing protein n=1 Tax=Cytophaga sp. FL35 TaxID=1904456 RepID=UPI001653EC29|nr:DUF11 domain-containing protein [Cytophaga sp. FL35]MBC7000693.1 DUF11 domain-containing protein [Cytophaga sp. FL35]
MKLRLFILTFMLSMGAFAQLSDLHYLPPLKQGDNNQAIQQQEVHLSTPETAAFTVNVYRGTSTSVLTSFTISNAAPAVYSLANGNNNITLVDNGNTGVVLTNGGLRFEAPNGERFYVNYRGQSGSQGASLTSKGRAAMGRKFKWGGVPNLGTHVSKSNTLGIMATENNTTINVSGYDPNCVFRLGNNASGITSDTYQITLNANESFVFEAYLGNTFSTAQSQGWLGASIVSDKDIVISNGSLNYGRQANNSNRDAGIDQPVPENRIGKEYVFIRGNGNSNGWTEFPLIIGTQNNTEIFVNGSATPIATINNGDYFEIPSSHYSSNSVGANMFVTTSKDAYAYQCIGGDDKPYTQGLNFVAPVNCLLPDTMDNIPDIRNVAGVTITGGVTIVASTSTPDGNITVTDGNGPVTLPSSSGVAGTPLWKTFYVPNLTGNVSVHSTGPIAVGFIGFNGARGVAGYFSGFDTVPEVDLQVMGGGCLPGATIEVIDANFDAYQWYQNGTLVPGAILSSYTPNEAGDYFVRVTKGGCTYDSQPIAAYYCDPDIIIEKTANKSEVLEGETVNFTITVESLGANPVTNLIVSDVMPSGFTLVSASPSVGTWNNPNWTVGTLNAGELQSIILVASANELPVNTQLQSYINTATHTQDQIDSNTSTDTPTASIIVHNDSDLDGISDSDDLDDDNDGILDSVECASGEGGTNLVFNGDFSSWYYNGWTPDGSNWQEPGSGLYAFYEDYNTGTYPLYQDVTVTNGTTYLFSFDVGTISTYSNSSTFRAYIDGTLVYTKLSDQMSIDNGGDTADTGGGNLSNTETVTFLYTASSNSARILFEGFSASQPHDEFFLDNVSLVAAGGCSDTDGDGIEDRVDLDSDGDGCTDANEAYSDANADGGDDGRYGSGNPSVNSDGTVTTASYNVPVDNNTNGSYDFQEIGSSPNILGHPADVSVFVPDNANFNVNASNADNYQWQLSVDNGISFTNITDGTLYIGTSTNELTVLGPTLDMTNYLYRVIITNNNYICGETISDSARLTARIRTVITNRRITYRTNKN